jgi:DNA-binding FadR family transcriptional regulator
MPTTGRADEVAHHLAELAAQATPGTLLGTKEQLRHSLGVSHSTLNEGIRLAVDRGSVTVRRGTAGGVFAARASAATKLGRDLLTIDISDPSTAELFRMRNSLEVLVGLEALENCSLHDLIPLEHSLRRLEERIEAVDPVGFLTECNAFQRHVASLVSNDLLKAIYGSLIDELDKRVIPITADDRPMTKQAMANRKEYFQRVYLALRERNTAELYRIGYESAIGWNPWQEFLDSLYPTAAT